MKKRILSLLLAVTFTLILTSTAFAAEDSSWEIGYSDDSVLTIYSDSRKDFQDLGFCKIGKLYDADGMPWNWFFSVGVFDDSIEAVEYEAYFSNIESGILVDFYPGFFAVEDGLAYVDFEYDTEAFLNIPIEETPFSYRDDIGNGWLFVNAFQRLEENLEPLDYVIVGTIVFTESQVAEFQRSGNLPPTSIHIDIASYLDLTELKTLLTKADLSAGAYSETPSPWAVEQVNAAIEANLVPDSLQSQYTRATTRAELCALAVTLYENVIGEITGRSTFTDTSDINVQKAAAIGIVSGVGDNVFAPDDKLTREQAAASLSRLADIIGKPLTRQNATFSDNETISSWALDSVGRMQAEGIMEGVGNNMFSPQGTYTREQCIITIMKLFDIVK